MAKVQEKKKTTAMAPVTIPSTGGMALLGDDGPVTPIVDSFTSSPYISFFHPMLKNSMAIVKGTEGTRKNGDVILIEKDRMSVLSPFEFICLPQAVFQYKAELDFEGKPVRCFEAATEDKNLDEMIDAIILIVHQANVLPVRCRFRGPKCPALKAAFRQVNRDNGEATTGAVWQNDFAGRSAEHAVAAASGLPRALWLTHSVTMTTKTPKARVDAEGKPVQTQDYELADSTSKATSAIVLKNIRTALTGEAFKKAIDECQMDWDKQKTEVLAKM